MHTQGILDVPTGKNLENPILASMEAMQWVLLYLSIGHGGVIENISHSTAKICRSTIMHVQYFFGDNSQIKGFRTHVYIGLFSRFETWNSCPKFVRSFHLQSVYCDVGMENKRIPSEVWNFLTSRVTINSDTEFQLRVLSGLRLLRDIDRKERPTSELK
jgi:hypothetical protein